MDPVISKNYPMQRIPIHRHCRVIGHATGKCRDLLEKWEAKTRQMNANLASSKLINVAKLEAKFNDQRRWSYKW